MALELGLLGEVTAYLDGCPVELGPARQRCVLAALAVDAGRVVPVDQLMGRVWGADAPRRRRATLYSHISRLRQALPAAVDVEIVLRSGGYVLVIDGADRAVDLLRFRELRARARAAEDDMHVVKLLSEAVALWRGEPLTGLSGQWVEAERDGLRQELLDAEHDLVDARLRAGDAEELVAELSARTARYPLDERPAAQYLLALHRAGRSADALEHYRQLRARLIEELGAEPGAGVQELHQRILAADSTLFARPGGGVPAPLAVPRQLPAAPAHFTGRETDLTALTSSLDLAGQDRTIVISAIGGAGGIGKTWLALAWAHRHAARFPDGQLFTDLRGFSPNEQLVAPDAALFGFLSALGVDANRIPQDLDAKAALYRSLMAGRRMVVLLDNAATADQVVPLLPGGPACVVLVTSRARLASLIDRHPVRHLQLDVLDRAGARALLAARLGTDRVEAEPAAVDELADLCGGYPLALSITARNAAARPAMALAEVAAELHELGLEVLDHDTDPAASLPAVLSWSLRRLTEEQRTLFGLLGVAPGPDATLPAVAALTGLPEARARKVLAALEEASLIGRRPGGRYAMHDLVRAYAATTADELPGDVREAALGRLMDFYLHTTHLADSLLDPHRPVLEPDPPASGVQPHPLPDHDVAGDWLRAEHATLLATQPAAAALGRHDVVWHLAAALDIFHVRRGYLHDALAMWRAALDSAAHLPNPATRSRAHRCLAYWGVRLGLHEEAGVHLDRALALAVHHRDPAEQAHTHRALGSALARRGDFRQALDHAGHALNLYRSLGMPVREADVLGCLGWYSARLGDFDTARDHCRAAIALLRRHQASGSEAAEVDTLGYVAHHTGDHQLALDHYYQALAMRRSLGQAYELADNLDSLGRPHIALGQHDRARAVWREALELYREQGRDDAAARVRRQLDELDGR